jgi:hypothetical protein
VSRGVVTSVFVLALLAATAAAFAVTERLKLEPPAISHTKVTKTFSTECECENKATIAFRLRKADRVTVTVTKPDGTLVTTLEPGIRVRPGFHHFLWNGRDDTGNPVPDGVYHVRVRLANADRRFELPNTIRLDTRPPTIRVTSLAPTVFSPDGDGVRDTVRARYSLDEHAHASMYVGSRRVVGPTRFAPLRGSLEWYGKLDKMLLPPGRYRVTLVARDLAGNLSPRTPPRLVVLRYIDIAPRVIRVRAGTRFSARLDTDVQRVAWRLGGRTGTSPVRRFVLRAPTRPGRYTLVVRAHGNEVRAAVLVRARR